MDQLKKLYRSLSATQRWSILILGVLIAAAVAWFTHQQREAGFRPLFSSLSPEDASGIVQKLKESGTDYRVSENGTSILVPEARVAELRLDIAGAGLPKTGRIGFEIFDKTNFGITDFAEHVNYRRAVEGELERTIVSIAEIDQARVHITFPKDSVYLDAREPAKASVLVRLRNGATLSGQNVAAITHLVSSAVEGLSPTSVSLVDMNGNLLNRPARTSADGDLSGEELEYRQKIEHDLQAKIAGTLEPLLGADKFRTAVSADCDMSAGEQSEEVFDPTKSVMVQSQRTEDVPGSTSIAGGQPGLASNLPNPPAPTPTRSTGSSRRVENVTYQSSRTTRHVKLAQGEIKRLSIAVLLDQTIQWEVKGKQMQKTLVPPTLEKIKSIHDIVATAVGLVPGRGDQLTVETLPFDATLNAAPPGQNTGTSKDQKAAPTSAFDQIKNNPILFFGGIGALAAILFVTVLLLRKKKRKTAELVDEMPALPRASRDTDTVALSRTAVAGEMNGAELPSTGKTLQLPPTRIEVLSGQLRESVARDSELWAGVVRSWLTEEERA